MLVSHTFVLRWEVKSEEKPDKPPLLKGNSNHDNYENTQVSYTFVLGWEVKSQEKPDKSPLFKGNSNHDDYENSQFY